MTEMQSQETVPVISVIMGTYNCKHTVAEAVASILGQEGPGLELIVCDDASADGTYEELLRLQAEAAGRMRVLRNEENRYLANCLNRCLAEARGAFIARMDGDDVSLPGRLERQYRFLQAHPELAMVGTDMILRTDWGGTRLLRCPARPDRASMAKHTPFFHATILARREVFAALGGYAEGEATKRSEDIDFYCRFFLAGFVGANLHEALYVKSESDQAMRNRSAGDRLASYRTKLRCYRRLGYSPLQYLPETLRLYKCLVPYPVLRWWRRVRQDKPRD